MIYHGNFCESYAQAYRIKQYTHTEKHHGRVVNYFDCWCDKDEPKTAFSENLNVDKVKQVDNAIRIQSEWGEIPQ